MKTVKQKRLEKYLELMKLSKEDIKEMYDKSNMADTLSYRAVRHKTDLHHISFYNAVPVFIASVTAIACVNRICMTIENVTQK